MERQVIIKDEDIKPDPEQIDCPVCALGLNHPQVDAFMAGFELELQSMFINGNRKSEVVQELISSYTKAELAFAMENLIYQIAVQKGLISSETREEIPEEDRDIFKSIFDDLLRKDNPLL